MPTVVAAFTITYPVSDLSGNAATPVTRTVTVAPQAEGGGGGVGIEVVLALLLLNPPAQASVRRATILNVS